MQNLFFIEISTFFKSKNVERLQKSFFVGVRQIFEKKFAKNFQIGFRRRFDFFFEKFSSMKFLYLCFLPNVEESLKKKQVLKF
jgi:hypothetical protein